MRIEPGQMVAASPAVSNRLPEAFADADAFDPGRYLPSRGRGRRQPVELDPLRRRPPPLRRCRLRHDAAQGHLLGPAAGLDLRAGPAAGHLPQRPHEDGRAAPAAVPWRATCAGAWSPRELSRGRRPRPVPGPRRVRVGGPDRVLGVEEGRAHRARRDAPGRRAAAGRAGREVLPHPCPVDRRGGLDAGVPREEIEEMVERWLDTNRRAEEAGDWTRWPTCTPRTPPTAGT